jgi:hypothetical protein
MLLFYILQKNYLNKSCQLFEDLLPYIISALYWNTTSTSQIHASMLLL